MILEIIATYLIAFFLLTGGFFTFVAAVGLLKLNSAMKRLHAPTKAGTMGIGAFLLASMVHSYTFGEGSWHEFLIMGFLFVTAPVSANFMAKVNLHLRAGTLPPPPVKDRTWSTLDVPEADRQIEDRSS
ncbi:MAG: monovalent cation/H(+) antiporter subunit G [Paracoccaceae bacterium]